MKWTVKIMFVNAVTPQYYGEFNLMQTAMKVAREISDFPTVASATFVPA